MQAVAWAHDAAVAEAACHEREEGGRTRNKHVEGDQDAMFNDDRLRNDRDEKIRAPTSTAKCTSAN